MTRESQNKDMPRDVPGYLIGCAKGRADRTGNVQYIIDASPRFLSGRKIHVRRGQCTPQYEVCTAQQIRDYYGYQGITYRDAVARFAPERR